MVLAEEKWICRFILFLVTIEDNLVTASPFFYNKLTTTEQNVDIPTTENGGGSSSLTISSSVVTAGDTATITCSNSQGPILWKLQFSVNNSELRLNNGHKFVSDKYNSFNDSDCETRLLIYNTSLEDAGAYSCIDARTNIQRTAQLVVIVSNSTCNSKTIVTHSYHTSLWCTLHYHGYWDPVMDWTVTSNDIKSNVITNNTSDDITYKTGDVIPNKTVGAYTSVVTIRRSNRTYDAYNETYLCNPRFTQETRPSGTDGAATPLLYSGACTVIVSWPVQLSGKEVTGVSTMQPVAAITLRSSSSNTDYYIFAGVIFGLIVLFSAIIIVICILQRRRVKPGTLKKDSASDSEYERIHKGDHRYQELNIDSSPLHNYTSVYNEVGDDSHYSSADPKRATYEYIPTDVYDELSTSQEPESQFPSRKEFYVTENTTSVDDDVTMKIVDHGYMVMPRDRITASNESKIDGGNIIVV